MPQLLGVYLLNHTKYFLQRKGIKYAKVMETAPSNLIHLEFTTAVHTALKFNFSAL